MHFTRNREICSKKYSLKTMGLGGGKYRLDILLVMVIEGDIHYIGYDISFFFLQINTNEIANVLEVVTIFLQ